MGQAQMNEELRLATMCALTRALMGRATVEDIHLLCWHAGISTDELAAFPDTEAFTRTMTERIAA